ncbi:diphosphate--fructose-6-phosphate 1-phosphotransferase [Blastopirellula sp. JC732]|uniref:Pyrophosphate--fructose 6-phosphate 1-phosphotransferase n=1 Tax=Blastopirellula sediminis TaxID=2894196 RepID=A0A9X1SJB5_9BACT|nr:diphosphate--fructose-6-phosphate 1-phosphotransferase [Blastopirellula sediminis]MCC9604514.1 diphosphate--fructose-6-phosphate 1-phosphotransferase [Blastopirellula sediminis]MCC9632187.1 diphosphate--fructose-6-phosphate 1-phosphotransferase [Blastopirellula sediminis]
MSAPKNMIVAQSGGPSPVINNTLRGIVEMARDLDNIGTVYGAHHGIEGVLKEELINLSDQPAEEISLLRYTPAAGSIGTCRYKLKDWQNEDFDRVIEVFKAHNIGYFVYIGGNDSMDTANKMAIMAQERGLDLIGIGGPKTIDNDVGDSEFKLIDHTPGYASTAKYWMHMVQYANEENQGSSPADPVLVMQAMGRKIGYIPAAARLADPNREMPLQIYLAESPCSLEELHQNVNEQLKKDGRCMVVISEGFNVGDIGEVKDAFGHTSFSSSQITVAQTVTNYLNQKGLAAKGAARCNVSGTDQRHAMAYASSVDLEEAYHAGQQAALLASNRESGFMSTILRNEGPVYSVRYDKAPLAEVANSERTFPKEWITPSGYDVTDEFVAYAKPLLGEGMISLPMIDGRQRMTRLQPIFAEQKLPAYVPQADRQKAPK